ncbi:hypothetical protein RIF29_20596 [Crotalaria pallida]|uniref:Myb-like domain-containing protein n=1 Tax=Crotalaria pallida TaxID=3830 RepID=A0AAN9F5X1_CROPI
MEDHHHNNNNNNHHHHEQLLHHQHQQQQYGISDLRQLLSGPIRPAHFNPIQPQLTAELFPGHRNLTPHNHNNHYEMMMLGRDIMPSCTLHHDFATDTPTGITVSLATNTTPAAATTSASTPPLSGLEAETACCIIGGDTSTGRWPRQETLTLLEIRSRLDPKFKEANQKGPLWDEVSSIMCDEHGYQRSGKKCREKFENLYKYYKKTKEGKAGRQDGKHYRFFRQLEALYGENSNHSSVPETNFGSSIRFKTNSQTHSQANHENFQSHSLSLTNSTDFDTSSSDDDYNDHNNKITNNNSIEGLMENNESMENNKRNKRKSGKSWKVKIKDFIDSQMRKVMEKQEEWLDKLVKTMENKEKERVSREEEWRKQEGERLEREHKFWAKERAWIEARDAALMDALQKITGRGIKEGNNEVHDEGVVMGAEIQNKNEDGSEILNSSVNVVEIWQELEIARLQQLKNEMETWEEVANKMACFGYERTAMMCKEKWESINNYVVREGNKKRKENSRSCFYFENNVNDQSSIYNQGSTYCDINDQRLQTNDSSSPSNSNVGHNADSCFPFMVAIVFPPLSCLLLNNFGVNSAAFWCSRTEVDISTRSSSSSSSVGSSSSSSSSVLLVVRWYPSTRYIGRRWCKPNPTRRTRSRRNLTNNSFLRRRRRISFVFGRPLERRSREPWRYVC